MIDILEKILAADGSKRRRLIKDFQESVWHSETSTEPGLEILSELALDLDFYEPDEKLRNEDSSYYGDERLKAEISSVIERVQNLRIT